MMNKFLILLSFFSFFLLNSIYSLKAEDFIPYKEDKGLKHQAIPEYRGRIVTENNLIYYIPEEDSAKILVGETKKKGSFILCEKAYASTCEVIYGTKSPEFNEDKNSEALYSVNIILKGREGEGEGGSDVDPKLAYHGLDEFIFATPNQEEAGSCLYMATTGAMEILLNKQTPASERLYDGNTDLSERFLMNVDAPTSYVPNWRTDTIYSYQYAGGGLLNKDYRYTKGWHKEVNGVLMKAQNQEVGAEYSSLYNWIDDYNDNTDLQNKMIKVPKAKRSIIFADANKDVWNTAQMSYRDIEKIKTELKNRNAPVLVIYNHFAYWHAVLIVGYDDEKDNGGCPFVVKWREYMKQKVEKLLASTDPKDQARGERYSKYVKQVDARWDVSGCRPKGVFYIRDSIYEGAPDLMYDYDKTQTGEELPYSKMIVEKSYDWIYYLANHAYVIYSN